MGDDNTPKRKASGWFDFKGADAAWDEWLAKRGLKCPLKSLGDALTKADREWDQVDRDWGLKKWLTGIEC